MKSTIALTLASGIAALAVLSSPALAAYDLNAARDHSTLAYQIVLQATKEGKSDQQASKPMNKEENRPSMAVKPTDRNSWNWGTSAP
jgi:precorrin-2 methylase